MRVERVDGKDSKIIAEGNMFNTQPEAERAKQRLSPDGYPAMLCGSLVKEGWGRATWRKPILDQTRIVHHARYDLCQIGYELTQGFQRYSNMNYRVFSGEQTWVRERQYHLVEDEFDTAIMKDAIKMADVLILNCDHDADFLHRQDMEGKKIIIYHHGPPYREQYPELNDLETEAGYGRLVSTPDLLQFGSWKSTPITWFPCPINLEEIDALASWEKPEGGPLQVLHSFTVSSNKLTPEFTSIVHEMEQDGENIEMGLIHLVNRQCSLWALSQADVYFATYLYGPGLATIEAMAMGIPALVGCSDRELQYQMDAVGAKRVDELPWIYVTPATTAEKLRDLQDPELRQHWATKGRKYVEEFHSVPSVVKRLEKFCDDLEPAKGVIYFAGERPEDKIVWKRKLRMF